MDDIFGILWVLGGFLCVFEDYSGLSRIFGGSVGFFGVYL